MPWDLHLFVIIADKYNYIIDTGLGSNSITPFLEILKQSENQNIIINTHYHWDHIWGNHLFKDNLIIAHKNCPDLIEKSWDSCLKEYSHFANSSLDKTLPNLLFDDELFFTDDQIRLIYTPGHTNDSISVIDEKEKTLFIADNIGDTMENLIPDLDCSKQTYKNSLHSILSFDFDICLCSHNRIVDKSTIQNIFNLL